MGYKSEGKIEKYLKIYWRVVKKNQNEGVVCTNNTIKLVDLNTFEEKQQIVKLENECIGHCAVDPIHEYLTYTSKN